MIRYIQSFCIIATAMFLFRFLMETIVFSVSPRFEIELAPMWMTYCVAVLVIASWFLVAYYHKVSEFIHSVVLTLFIVTFYAIIAAPGAYAAKAAGAEQIDIYRHNILEFSVRFIPANLLGIMWLADARQLNARFKYILMGLITILILSMISSKGISLKPPH
jgi:hypothetical protein